MRITPLPCTAPYAFGTPTLTSQPLSLEACDKMARQIPARLTARLYGFTDADRIAGVSRGTAKRWLSGYSYTRPDGTRTIQAPVTPGRVSPTDGVSFTDLV